MRRLPPSSTTVTRALGQAAPAGGDGGRARPGAAGAGEPYAALPHPQPDAVGRQHLRRLDVGALRKQRMPFDDRAEQLDRRALGIIDEEHRVRVADVDRHRIAQRSRLDAEVQRVRGFRPAECPASRS